MSNIQYIPQIVMFTISDSELRDKFRDKLKVTFSLSDRNWLNESAYFIDSIEPNKVANGLAQLVSSIKNDGYTFGISDFVSLYYAAALVNTKTNAHRDKIIKQDIGLK
jgi:hypothetical protein